MDDDVDALFASTSASEEQDTPVDTPLAQPVSLPIPGLYIVKRWLDEREQVNLFALTHR